MRRDEFLPFSKSTIGQEEIDEVIDSLEFLQRETLRYYPKPVKVKEVLLHEPFSRNPLKQ